MDSTPDPHLAPLTRVGVRDLRADLAAMIRRAGGGERIVITVDGQPAAILGPPSAAPDLSLETLFAAGLATPPRRDRPTGQPEPVSAPVDIRIDDVVDELRGR